jgi:hypothetical protein
MEDVITRVPEAATRSTSTIMGKPLKELTPEENKKYQNLRAIKSRSAKKAREKAVNYKWNSTSELTRSEGLEILSTRITNPHVRKVCYDLAVEAADGVHRWCGLRLLHNFSHHVQSTIEIAPPRNRLASTAGSIQIQTRHFVAFTPTKI